MIRIAVLTQLNTPNLAQAYIIVTLTYFKLIYCGKWNHWFVKKQWLKKTQMKICRLLYRTEYRDSLRFCTYRINYLWEVMLLQSFWYLLFLIRVIFQHFLKQKTTIWHETLILDLLTRIWTSQQAYIIKQNNISRLLKIERFQQMLYFSKNYRHST